MKARARARFRFPSAASAPARSGSRAAGRLIDWEIQNRPAKGITNGLSHFAVKAEQDGKVLDARILNGPYLGNRTGDFPADTSRNFGFGARRDSLAGMPHFCDQHLRGPLPGRQAQFCEPGVSGCRRAHRVQSLHPAQRPRLRASRWRCSRSSSPIRPTRRSPTRRSAWSATGCTRRPRQAASSARARPASRS